jgi:dynein heavy chain
VVWLLRACVMLCCRSVEQASARLYAELRRHFYTTPKSYLDLISLYLQLLQERK